VNSSKLNFSVDGDVAVLQLLDPTMLSGEFCASTQALLGDAAREQPDANVVVDLAGIEYVSSEGLGVLLSLRSQLQATSRRLCLINVAPLIVEVFEATRLNRLFPIVSDVAAAQRIPSAPID
jgi:anti-sigma B factor antagonist